TIVQSHKSNIVVCIWNVILRICTSVQFDSFLENFNTTPRYIQVLVNRIKVELSDVSLAQPSQRFDIIGPLHKNCVQVPSSASKIINLKVEVRGIEQQIPYDFVIGSNITSLFNSQFQKSCGFTVCNPSFLFVALLPEVNAIIVPYVGLEFGPIIIVRFFFTQISHHL